MDQYKEKFITTPELFCERLQNELIREPTIGDMEFYIGKNSVELFTWMWFRVWLAGDKRPEQSKQRIEISMSLLSPQPNITQVKAIITEPKIDSADCGETEECWRSIQWNYVWFNQDEGPDCAFGPVETEKASPQVKEKVETALSELWSKILETFEPIKQQEAVSVLEIPPATSLVQEPEETESRKWENFPGVEIMKRHYEDYSPITADLILKAIPRAFEDYDLNGGRWGPGIIAKYASVGSTTVGRYLKAFREVGISKWEGISLP